jgi:ankyrin repeat protein
MLIKIIWTLIGLNTLLLLYMLWEAMAKNSDPAGNGMANAFTTLIGVGLFISLCLMMISRNPAVLVLSGLFSCGPILIGISYVGSWVDKFTPATLPEPPPAEAYFSSEKQIALAKAIVRGDTALIRTLVSEGASLNGMEQGSTTPLQFALFQINPSNEATIRESIRTLIALGADPNPNLAETVKFASAEVTKVFLEGGADPNQTDEFSDPLFFTVLAYGKQEVVQAFVEKGANIHIFTTEGWSPLMHLANYGNWPPMLYLLEIGADYKHSSPDGKSLESLLKEYYARNGSKRDTLPEGYVVVCQWLKKQGIIIY